MDFLCLRKSFFFELLYSDEFYQNQHENRKINRNKNVQESNVDRMKVLLNVQCFSRTLTSVHDAILHDLVYPAEITGKRIRIKLDGSRLFKIHLDKNQQTLVENKVHPMIDNKFILF